MVFGISINETYRLITDHLGSVREVVNTNTGDIVQRIDYDEYGILSDNNYGFTPFGIAGGLYNPETGLVLQRSRVPLLRNNGLYLYF
jgi:hypothetical protein